MLDDPVDFFTGNLLHGQPKSSEVSEHCINTFRQDQEKESVTEIPTNVRMDS